MSTKSYIGALVSLNRRIETKGGIVFNVGVRMRVIDSKSNGLTLWVRTKTGSASVIGVEKSAVTVLEWKNPTKEKE